jgi:5-formyltetrahydrofolate cyclo-ligase
MDKVQLRQQIQSRLLKMTDELRAEKSKKAFKNLISLPQFQQASVIMMYLTMPNEIDTSDAIFYAWQQKKTVVVPKISWQKRHMIPVEINSLEKGFSTEVAGLRNPVKGRPIPFEDIDLVVAPGLGFDKMGNRLGRGGAYYDRFFANKKLNACKCGFAFSEQVVESVPVQQHDMSVDFLVTDEEIMDFRNRQGE